MWSVTQGILGISVYSFCKLYIDLLFFTSKNCTINSILLYKLHEISG